MLRIGSRGSEVKALQQLLRSYAPGIADDGVFGVQTERALRLAQRRHAIYPPDGVAGPITLGVLHAQPAPKPQLSALHPRAEPKPTPPPAGKGDPGPLAPAVDGARSRATHGPAPAAAAAPPCSMTTSQQGRLFIAAEEEQTNVSNHLHHPSAASGVTLGPGYDMRGRRPAEISTDLGAIGVSPSVAAKAAQGSGKSGAIADEFVNRNKELVDLDTVQQAALLNHVIGHYEAMVQRQVHVPLHQYEFDALVSFAYNPGRSWTRVVHLINQQQRDPAMKAVHSVVTSGGKIMSGLVTRRDREVRLFLYGEYK